MIVRINFTFLFASFMTLSAPLCCINFFPGVFKFSGIINNEKDKN